MSGKRPRIYIGNVSYDATEADIRDFFGAYKVKQVNLITDKETNRPKGFAFVELETFDDVDRAISELDGEFLMGRPLRVNEARERPPGPPRNFSNNPRNSR